MSHAGFARSRESAKKIIKSGGVLVDGIMIDRASFEIPLGVNIEILDEDIFVGRGGYKLQGFIEDSGFCVDGEVVLDVGSSTGGFAQALLKNGAERVFCVDVGSNQLSQDLRGDGRIILYENCDIREFEKIAKDGGDDIGPFSKIVCDVSFISLGKVLLFLYNLLAEDGHMALLFKPQFEVGRDVKRDKKGVVLDLSAIEESLNAFKKECEDIGLEVLGDYKSKLKGKAGNEESFVYLKK